MILVVGASGATGRLLVQELLNRGQHVKAIVRSPDKLLGIAYSPEQMSVIHASLLDIGDAELAQHVNGCAAVASCLGHSVSFKGIYGHRRWLVADATRRLCMAIRANAPKQPTKFVLMNTAGNSNRDLHEPISFGQRCVVTLLRLLLPPHADNERAADYLRTCVGKDDSAIEWATVRPDSLVDENVANEYDVLPSPARSAVFNPGTTSRSNVAHFMADLITDDAVWRRWRSQMPVIYNKESRGKERPKAKK